MAITFAEIREIALAFPGVEERPAHAGRQCFRTRKRMIAWGYEDGDVIALYMPLEARDILLDEQPDVFSIVGPEHSYPSVIVNMEAADAGLVAELIEDAWRLSATKQQIAEWEASR